MNKYAEITTTEGPGLISIANVSSCYINEADEIIVDYNNGSSINIASASLLLQKDADTVFNVIKSAQEDKWSTIKYKIPLLTQPVDAVTFTFN